MRCELFRDRLAELWGGELESRERLALAAHLAECAGCRDLSASHQALVDEARRSELPLPDDAYWAGFMAGVRQRLGSEGSSWWAWLGGRPAALAASTALVLLVVWVLRPSGGLPGALPSASAREAAPAEEDAALLESLLELTEPLDPAHQPAGLYDLARGLELWIEPAVSQWDLLERSVPDPFTVFEQELSDEELGALRAALHLESG